MQFSGRYRLAASRDAVWAALNDTAVLGAAIPGCQRLDWAGPEQLKLELRANLGLIQPVFRGELLLSKVVPARSYTLTGRGRGGLLGQAEGSAEISLSDAGEGTEMEFLAHGGGSGQLMRLGQALIGNSAQRVIDGFFARFAAAMDVGITALPSPELPHEGKGSG